ncbi:MAG TPA: hypothetical protein VFF59_13585 [Anaerolineae bacterium]|nr:hypothetical protein [Anaerolineae bacterium]
MAKKTRKVLKQESQQRAIQQAAANITTALAAATTDAAAAQKSVSTSVRAVSASEDYRYVKSDLRRISILAASFTAILVALSFVIR